MTAVLAAIAPEHMVLVRDVLRRTLPAGATVRIFGSRAGGAVKPFSDLDLVVDAGRPLSLRESAALSDEFSDSALPWKVDIVDRHAITETFWRLIEPGSLPLEM